MERFDLRKWQGFIDAFHFSEEPVSTNALEHQNLDIIIDQITIDSRRIDSKNALFVALPGTKEDGHSFVFHAFQSGAKFALVKKDYTPQAPLPKGATLLKVEDPLHAFQQIVKAYRKERKAKVISISGSHGKTMVKDLLLAILQQHASTVASPESFNSQIGVPLSLLTISDAHDYALIEAGISEKNEMDALVNMIDPDYSIVTHIDKKHLTTFGDLKVAAEETLKITKHSQEWVLLPDNHLTKAHTSAIFHPISYWNKEELGLPHAYETSSEFAGLMPYSVTFPDGNHYSGETTFGFSYFIDLLNITLKAAWKLKIPSELICKALRSYTPEPMRTEIWKTPLGTTFVNDVYCSDPQSVDRAFKFLEPTSSQARKVFIFSGMRGKTSHSEIDYRRIGETIVNNDVKIVCLAGQKPFAPLIEEIQSRAPHVEILEAKTMEEGLQALRPLLKSEDVILVKGNKKISLDSITEAFDDSLYNNQCVINLAAIEANIKTLRKKLTPKTRMMVMVKALAYGTDDVRIAKFLNSCGVDILGVSYVDEGVSLKRAQISQEIFVINAAIYEAHKIAKWDLQVGVSEDHLVAALNLEGEKLKKKIKVHLHIDTGMGRFGCRPEKALQLAELIKNSLWLELEGVMTHFASADDPKEDLFTHLQAKRFNESIQAIEAAGIALKWKHASNSSAVMRFDFPEFNMVRIGLAVYGLYPSEATKAHVDLKLALTLKSRIVGINICTKGDSISYGRTYIVEKDTQKIAVLPIGYFDGLHRNYSGKGAVVIQGKKAPMIGRICMDYMMVDVTEIPNGRIGDPVLIFGEDEYGNYNSPEDLALSGDSIVYELITCLGPRIQRVFLYEEAQQLR